MSSITKAIGWDAGNAGNGREYSIYTPTGPANTYPGYQPNANKIVHLAFCNILPSSLLSGNLGQMIDSLIWDNWRDGETTIKGNVKAPSFKDNKVPENIFPVTESLQVQGGFTYGTKTATEMMKGGAGAILNTLETAARTAESVSQTVKGAALAAKATVSGASSFISGEHYTDNKNKEHFKFGNWQDGAGSTIMGSLEDSGFRQGTLTSKISDFPILDPEATTAVAPTSLVLEFTLGNGGYFDGELEVVRPIAAIENKVAPVLVDRSMIAPMGSGSQFMGLLWGASASALGGTLDAVNDTITKAKQAGENASGGTGEKLVAGMVDGVKNLADLGYEVQENIIKAKEQAIGALANYTTVLFTRLGNSINGPFIVEGCSHTFDYSKVDEKGYPFKGTLTMSLKYIFKPTGDDILTQMGYKIDASTYSASKS